MMIDFILVQIFYFTDRILSINNSFIIWFILIDLIKAVNGFIEWEVVHWLIEKKLFKDILLRLYLIFI